MKKISKVIFQIILGLVVVGLIILVVRLRPGSEAISPGSPGAYPGPGETDAGDAPLLSGTEAPYPPPGLEETQWVENSKPILPPCVFPLTPIEESGPIDAPIDLQFSEPQIVYTSATGIGIAEWLPDGENLLLAQETTYGKQIIETFNTRTGEVHIYAERHYAGGKPIWIEELNAVAYTTFVQDHEELWISYGDPNQTEQLYPEIFTLSLEKMGGQLLFFSPSGGDQPLSLDLQSKSALDFEISLEDMAYSRFPPGIQTPIPGTTFQISVQSPGKNIIFFGAALLYVANTETQEICEIDLGIGSSGPNWAHQVQWSQDGRYLAMMVVSTYPGSIVPVNKLMILDMVTGEKTFPEIEAQYIYEYTWSPDQNTLLALGNVGSLDGRAKMGLFLVDVYKKIETWLLPDFVFGGGAGEGTSMAWSTNGNRIAIKCPDWSDEQPVIVEDHICIIDVKNN